MGKAVMLQTGELVQRDTISEKIYAAIMGREIVAKQRENETIEEFIKRGQIEVKKYGFRWLTTKEKVERAWEDKDLDALISDESDKVRAKVAERRYGLDILINDKSDIVRATVARTGYGLEKLVDDESPLVKVEVAKKRYGLDKLINDKDEQVRLAVAKMNYGLDKLVKDESKEVRKLVAERGYGLDSLFYDTEREVKLAAEDWLYKNNSTLEEYKEKYPDKCIFGIKEKEGIEKNVKVERLNLDKSIPEVKNEEKEQIEKYYRSLATSDWLGDRVSTAKKGYSLDILVNDKESYVRSIVAEQGYGLDQLINDERDTVRAVVAKKGYRLDLLMDDESDLVRRTIAEQGIGLEKYINDESPKVRKEVAKQGYGLDKLYYDRNSEVKIYGAEKWLNDHKLTLDEYIEKYPEKCFYSQEKSQDLIEKLAKKNKENFEKNLGNKQTKGKDVEEIMK